MIRILLRWLLAMFYSVAGMIHLVNPEPFLRIMPAPIPFPLEIVLLTGIAELAGAVALVQPWSVPFRRAGGIGLALYALCVWPANVNHMLLDMSGAMEGPGLAYHLPRLIIGQPLLIWLSLWVSRPQQAATDIRNMDRRNDTIAAPPKPTTDYVR